MNDYYENAHIVKRNVTKKCFLSAKSRSKHRDKDYDRYFTEIENFVVQDGYPCIGAQTSINSKAFALGLFENMDEVNTAGQLLKGLYSYIEEMTTRPSDFLTYIAVFKNDSFESEMAFEESLWNLLVALHTRDIENYEWSEDVGKDPSRSDFSFSIGGHAFFLVGMHPLSSRAARRFKYPAIAFNLHSQFENLRTKGRFEIIKSVVRDRELKYQGNINPMLADYGKGLEAPQYSGRKVGADWKCPFRTKD